METYTHICAHLGGYMREMTLWDGNPPGTPYPSPTDGTGRLAPGPQGQDREAAFADWHRANYGIDHADPCDGSATGPAASPDVYRAADQAVTDDGGKVRLLLTVDAEPPAGDFHVQLLAPVFREPGQLASVEVHWRGSQPPGGRTMRRSPQPG
jgi:hypothetical protein